MNYRQTATIVKLLKLRRVNWLNTLKYVLWGHNNVSIVRWWYLEVHSCVSMLIIVRLRQRLVQIAKCQCWIETGWLILEVHANFSRKLTETKQILSCTGFKKKKRGNSMNKRKKRRDKRGWTKSSDMNNNNNNQLAILLGLFSPVYQSQLYQLNLRSNSPCSKTQVECIKAAQEQ